MIYKISPRRQSSMWFWTAYMLKCSCPRKIISKIAVNKTFLCTILTDSREILYHLPQSHSFPCPSTSAFAAPPPKKLKIKILIKKYFALLSFPSFYHLFICLIGSGRSGSATHLRGQSQWTSVLTNLAATQAKGPHPLLWVDLLQHLPHLWPTGAWKGTGPVEEEPQDLHTMVNSRIFERSFGKGPVLMMYQKP